MWYLRVNDVWNAGNSVVKIRGRTRHRNISYTMFGCKSQITFIPNVMWIYSRDEIKSIWLNCVIRNLMMYYCYLIDWYHRFFFNWLVGYQMDENFFISDISPPTYICDGKSDIVWVTRNRRIVYLPLQSRPHKRKKKLQFTIMHITMSDKHDVSKNTEAIAHHSNWRQFCPMHDDVIKMEIFSA